MIKIKNFLKLICASTVCSIAGEKQPEVGPLRIYDVLSKNFGIYRDMNGLSFQCVKNVDDSYFVTTGNFPLTADCNLKWAHFFEVRFNFNPKNSGSQINKGFRTLVSDQQFILNIGSYLYQTNLYIIFCQKRGIVIQVPILDENGVDLAFPLSFMLKSGVKTAFGVPYFESKDIPNLIMNIVIGEDRVSLQLLGRDEASCNHIQFIQNRLLSSKS